MIAGIILLAISLIIIIWGISNYNRFIKLKVLIDEAWSITDVFLKKRYDLIPNLVESVKGYATHEQETLENVILARSKAMGAKDMGERAEYEGELGGFLGRLMAVTEQYPALRANENFMYLQKELTQLEGEIEKARRYYNGTVRENNIAIKVFPASIIAGMFNFTEGQFFEIVEKAQREAPKVSFNK
jgi:Uncharacterized conserved protein